MAGYVKAVNHGQEGLAGNQYLMVTRDLCHVLALTAAPC